MIKLVTFLGNPGTEHLQTRHNAGWMLCEALESLQGNFWQTKFKGQYLQQQISGNKFIFLKPETYMNLSGSSVLACMQFFKITPEELMVVHDDLELDFGQIGLKEGGGLGGHNGLRSIAQVLGTNDFYRFRLGISRPSHRNVSAYVLSKFSPDEQIVLSDYLKNAANIFKKIFAEDIDRLVKRNQKVKLINA